MEGIKYKAGDTVFSVDNQDGSLNIENETGDIIESIPHSTAVELLKLIGDKIQDYRESTETNLLEKLFK